MMSDCDLIAKKNHIDFIWNSKFPINSLIIMRGYLFISVDVKNLYLDVMFDAYWKDNHDISNRLIVKDLLKKCKINSDNFFESVSNPRIKNKLKNFTKEAQDKEIFGTPTFVVNDKVFWGQDSLVFALEEYNR